MISNTKTKITKCFINHISNKGYFIPPVLQGAAAVAGAGVIQSICLPLLSVYAAPSNGASQVTHNHNMGASQMVPFGMRIMT